MPGQPLPVVHTFVRLPRWHPDAVTGFLDGARPGWQDPSTWTSPDAGDLVLAGGQPLMVASWSPHPVTRRAASITQDLDGGIVLSLSVDCADLSTAPPAQAEAEVRRHAEQTLGHLMRLARTSEGYASFDAEAPTDAEAWRRAVRDPRNLLSTE